jgi:enediyne polyketide synthase
MIKNRTLLKEYEITTSLCDSNLVGNIYFANYSKWLGRNRDSYFYSILSDYYKGIGEKGEFLCVNCNIDHLGEAMPFDTILVKMFLEKIYENGMDLNFEFYKEQKSQKIQKLAFARQRIVWSKRIENKIISNKIPDELIAFLK